MAYSDETRRYLAKVSRVGIVGAVLCALLHGAIRYMSLVVSTSVYQFKYMFGVGNSLIPEATVALAGILSLVVCILLSFIMKNRPALSENAWIAAGRITLLSAPVGYIWSLGGTLIMARNALSVHMEFLYVLVILAAIFVGYALGIRGISVNESFLGADGRTYARRVLKNTAVVLGVMLAAVLLLIGRQWHLYGEALGLKTGLFTLVETPLRVTSPVVLAVTLVYPLLSLVSRWNTSFHGKLLGKGTMLLGWVALALTALSRTLSLSETVISAGRSTGSLLMDAYERVIKIQAVDRVISPLAACLGIWTLCLLLPRIKGHRLTLWGARLVLGVAILRRVTDWILELLEVIYRMTFENNTGIGIIGGADFTVTVFTARVESWTSFLFTVLSIAALVVLTIGLTRRFRVGKAFWCVPVLTVASFAASLVVSVICELVMRETSTESVLSMSIAITVVTAVLGLARSLVGILTLSRTPADTVTPPPTPAEAVEPPKPRVEDYLYQL